MQFRQATLPNGLEVVAEVNPGARSAGLGFFVRAGSRDEPAGQDGVSHFLEHMVFKGTDRRDALAVNQQLDRVGARHNAQTSEEETIYHLACLPEYLPRGFEVLADILRPALRAADFETEKLVILEEIRKYQDDPISVAYERARALHYGPHPLGRSVLGTAETVGALTADAMKSYFESRYAAPNVVLAAAGAVDWDQLLALADERCGAWGGAPPGRAVTPARGSSAFEAIRRDEDQQATLIAIADGPPLEGDDRYAAALLATIVGDHTSSRLYWDLVDPGHAEAADLSYQDYHGTGAFLSLMSCAPEDAGENLARLSGVLRDARRSLPTDAELEQAKNKVMARAVIRYERPFWRMMSVGYHWLGRREHVSVEQELDLYARVSRDDLIRVLDRWPLWPATVVAAGPPTMGSLRSSAT